MPKKFNKKEAFGFRLLHRSQQDPLYHKEQDGASGSNHYVLEPMDERTYVALQALNELEAAKNPEAAIGGGANHQEIKHKGLDEIDENGLPVDGYDYYQHLAPITGQGVFVANDGSLAQKPFLLSSMPRDVLKSDKQLDRMLESITVDDENMDPDIRELLFGSDDVDETEEKFHFDDEAFDKLNSNKDLLLDDDFVMQLVQRENEATAAGDQTAEFDFEAHMKRLMEQAEEEDIENENNRDGFQFESEEELVIEDPNEKGLDDLEKQIRMLQLSNSTARNVENDIFTKFLENEFDNVTESDNFNEQLINDNIDSDARGDNSDCLHDEIADDSSLVLNDKEKIKVSKALEFNGQIFIAKTEDLSKMKVQKALPKRELFNFTSEEVDHPDQATKAKTVQLGDMIYNENLPQQVPDYVKYQPKEKFDCQTIVSTFSRAQNLPTVLSAMTTSNLPARLNKKSERINEEEISGSEVDSESELESNVNKGEKRDTKETTEEKRVRKLKMKEIRRERRVQKKNLKVVFKEEKSSQVAEKIRRKQAALPLQGVSTFRL